MLFKAPRHPYKCYIHVHGATLLDVRWKHEIQTLLSKSYGLLAVPPPDPTFFCTGATLQALYT